MTFPAKCCRCVCDSVSDPAAIKVDTDNSCGRDENIHRITSQALRARVGHRLSNRQPFFAGTCVRAATVDDDRTGSATAGFKMGLGNQNGGCCHEIRCENRCSGRWDSGVDDCKVQANGFNATGNASRAESGWCSDPTCNPIIGTHYRVV
jgi:hypothetical protein